MSQAQQDEAIRPAVPPASSRTALPSPRTSGSVRRPGGATGDAASATWIIRELRSLESSRPGLAAALRRIWHRPAAVLVPLGFLVPGLLGAVIAGGDAAWFRRAGASMLGPGIWDVFSDPGLQIGPLYLLTLGLLHRAAEVLGLPVLFTLAGVQCGLLTWFALATTRRVVTATGVTGARAAAAPWAVGLPLTLGGFLAEAVGNGHPEDILIGLLLVEAALLAAAGRRVLPGLLLGVTGGLKLWGVLGAPLLLLGRRPATIAVRCLLAGGVVALCYVPFFVWGDVRTFEFQWGVSAGSTLALLSSYAPTGWLARLLQGAAAGLAGSAVALTRRPSPLVVVIVVVAARLVLDPLRLTYYSGPLVVVALLWMWTSPAVRTRVAVVLTALAPVTVLSPYLLPSTLFGVLSTAVLVGIPVAVLVAERSVRRRAQVPAAAVSTP